MFSEDEVVQEFLFTLVAGQDFGDLALLSETNTRTCTIKSASDETKLIQLSKDSFLEYVGEYKTESIKKIIRLFDQSVIFKGVSTRSKKVLASKSFYLKYPANTVVVKQGDQVYNIYIVSKGGAVVVRRCQKSSIERQLTENPSLNKLVKEKVDELSDSFLLQVEYLRKFCRVPILTRA